MLNDSLKQFASISLYQFMIMVFAELAATTLVVWLNFKHRRRDIKLTDIAAVFCLIVYGNIILQLTLLGRENGSRIGIELSLFQYLGQGSFSRHMLNYAFLNMLLFVPYGFIIRWLPWFRRQKAGIGLLLVTLVSLASSLLIEMMQLITQRGYYELEDLLCNTLGGLLGGIIFGVVYRLLNGRESKV